MDKKLLIKTYVPFTLIWVLDYFIKYWFVHHHHSFGVSFIQFTYVENHGIILGKLGELPSILKNVFLSTTGIAIVSSLPLSMAIYKFKSSYTAIGLSLILAGILGNVTDRIIYGFVVDYIYLQISTFRTPVFNLADGVQWFGYILFISGFFQEISFHNPQNDKRSGGWIDKSFQIKFSLALVSIFLAMGAVFTVCGFTFLKFSLLEQNLDNTTVNHYLRFFVLTSLVIMGVSSLILMLIGKMISHRIAGPCHAIKRFLQDSMAGNHYPLKLREDDYLKELEKPLTDVFQKILEKERIP